MDYEKKYNEALEQAKGYMDAGSSDLTDVLPEIFPELRESEDEKIRKDIIGGLMWQRDNLKSEGPHDNNLILPGFCLTVGKHLTYLEKQKEKSLGDFIDDFPYSTQKEQKPNYCHYGGDPNIERCKYCSAACSARLTEEQKPVETSDFKTKLAEYLQNNSPKDGQYVISSETILEMAKEELIKRGVVVEREQCCMGIKGDPDPAGVWKPTEEQMTMLRAVLNDPNNAGAESCQLALSGLYEQLKKL